jgi:hypothetical protein
VFQEFIKLRLLAPTISINLVLVRLFNGFRSILRFSFVDICVDELTVTIVSGNPAWWCLGTAAGGPGCVRVIGIQMERFVLMRSGWSPNSIVASRVRRACMSIRVVWVGVSNALVLDIVSQHTAVVGRMRVRRKPRTCLPILVAVNLTLEIVSKMCIIEQ